jgi:hypothetical protein
MQIAKVTRCGLALCHVDRFDLRLRLANCFGFGDPFDNVKWIFSPWERTTQLIAIASPRPCDHGCAIPSSSAHINAKESSRASLIQYNTA